MAQFTLSTSFIGHNSLAEPPASQYTGTFLNLLQKTGNSLVVSTYQARKLVILRAQGEAVNTHFVDLRKPMGMAYQNGRLSVGTGSSVIDYFNSASAAMKVPPGNAHDAAFLPRGVHITGDIDIHEMAFDGNGELWVVNTRLSCLCTLDSRHSFVPQWRPPFISAYDGTDRCHLNGLAMRDGKPRYVTALGATDQPGGWRDNKASGGVLLNIENNRIIANGLCMPHSPRWYRNKLWVLESGSGQLVSIDETTGEKTVVADVPGFCRGLDFIDQYAIIGLSEVRETSVFAGLPLTAREQDRKCGIWVVDIETGQSVAWLAFTTGVQEIFAVQCLPMRYPALLGLDDKLLDTSYSVPSSVIAEFVPPDPKQVMIDTASEHHRHKDFWPAIEIYRRILADDPDDSSIQYRLADALSHCGQWDEAFALLNNVIASRNDHAQAHNLRGQFFAHSNELEQAIESYNTAISIDRQFAEAYFHRGCARLMQGDWQRGWEDYEWRTRIPGAKTFSLPRPRWQGEDISDKTLLVLTEDSIADAILFARFLPLARQRCNKLLLVCDESLRRLFKEIDGVDEVRVHGKLQSDLFDVYVSIASLGAVLQIEIADLTTQSPCLTINNDVIVADPRTGENQAAQRPRVGIAWSEDSAQCASPQDACRLSDIVTLADNQTLDVYSLQQRVFAEDRKVLEAHGVTILEQELTNYAQAGAWMQQMDLMVCASSGTAHLAGALGLPTIVLLPDRTDWRWMGDATSCTWYPSVTVLRQQIAGDWSDPLEQCQKLIRQRFGAGHRT